MQGRIVQLNVSPGGLPKRSVPGGLISSEGLEGDAHAHPEIHGGPTKAILLIASETIHELQSRGYPVFYGALGENLTTSGIETRALRLGDRLRAGEALLELTRPRGPCKQLDVYGPSIRTEIFDQRVKQLDHASPVWGMSGFYARVLEPGRVEPGDIIAIVASQA